MKRANEREIAITLLGAILVVLVIGVGWTAHGIAEVRAQQALILEAQAESAEIATENDFYEETEELFAATETDAEIDDFSWTDVSVELTQEPLGEFKITYYCPCEICCGPYANGITASGAPCVEGVTCASDYLPIGTMVNVDGAIYTVRDRFGAFDGSKTIDIYVEDHDRALALGTHRSEVYEVIAKEAEPVD